MKLNNVERENKAISDSKAEITFKPVKLEEIMPPSKEDLEIMLMWNLKMFPFLLKNYDAIFKGEGKGEAHSNPEHKIIHVISSDYCPNSSPYRGVP